MHLGGLALVLTLFASHAEAQSSGRVPRVGYLSLATAEGDKSRVAALRQGLRELGYVERENVVIEYRYAAHQGERMLELATELARLKVDILVVYGRPEAVRKVTGPIPIVFPVHADPVGIGLVASLARPGGNVTGLSDLHAGTVAKRLELLKEVVPAATTVAVLWNPATAVALTQLKSLRAAAPTLGMTILPVAVKGPRPNDIDRALATMERARPGALLIIAEQTIAAHRNRIIDFAIKNRLPAISTLRIWADSGLLMAYGTNFDDLWRRTATYVDKILKGANPGDLPVERANKWDLVINLKTAKALGLAVPQSMLLRADDVIQ